jgi:hypothetical protein
MEIKDLTEQQDKYYLGGIILMLIAVALFPANLLVVLEP